MAHPEFLNVIQSIYKSLLNGVQGLQAQGHVILSVVENIKSAIH
jgi:vacuolar protein sorting-associated protein 54